MRIRSAPAAETIGWPLKLPSPAMAANMRARDRAQARPVRDGTQLEASTELLHSVRSTQDNAAGMPIADVAITV